MTLKEMIDQVRLEIGDISVSVPGAAITKWLNDGQNEIARVTKSVTDTVTTNAVDGQYDYPLPDDYIEVLSVMYKDSADDDPRPLAEISYRDIQATASLSEGNPQYYALYRDALWICPTVGQDLDDAISVHYCKTPEVLDTDSDVSELPTRFHVVAVHYAIWRALASPYVETDIASIGAAAALYRGEVGGARSDWRNREANRYRQFRRNSAGGTGWGHPLQKPTEIPEP